MCYPALLSGCAVAKPPPWAQGQRSRDLFSTSAPKQMYALAGWICRVRVPHLDHSVGDSAWEPLTLGLPRACKQTEYPLQASRLWLGPITGSLQTPCNTNSLINSAFYSSYQMSAFSPTHMPPTLLHLEPWHHHPLTGCPESLTLASARAPILISWSMPQFQLPLQIYFARSLVSEHHLGSYVGHGRQNIYIYIFFFLRYGLCSPSWPKTHSPAFALQVLRLHAFATMSDTRGEKI
jgi:hypothetical protein